MTAVNNNTPLNSYIDTYEIDKATNSIISRTETTENATTTKYERAEQVARQGREMGIYTLSDVERRINSANNLPDQSENNRIIKQSTLEFYHDLKDAMAFNQKNFINAIFIKLSTAARNNENKLLAAKNAFSGSTKKDKPLLVAELQNAQNNFNAILTLINTITKAIKDAQNSVVNKI